ncbi:hypothetical protein BO71DRAFT_135036 [Aspergillus ellipticus CBS 707.79]|uniref:Uncharacterized protein n=1 Tax=Aspergillus ellipticus CBS 707.79 TaxID=1448320 RepID=A0A319DIN7_9EURO|nr:hypothetical protein BO71DRAFT_135036 [Aspergillus ellipticus CBS 707.79]
MAAGADSSFSAMPQVREWSFPARLPLISLAMFGSHHPRRFLIGYSSLDSWKNVLGFYPPPSLARSSPQRPVPLLIKAGRVLYSCAHLRAPWSGSEEFTYPFVPLYLQFDAESHRFCRLSLADLLCHTTHVAWTPLSAAFAPLKVDGMRPAVDTRFNESCYA